MSFIHFCAIVYVASTVLLGLHARYFLSTWQRGYERWRRTQDCAALPVLARTFVLYDWQNFNGDAPKRAPTLKTLLQCAAVTLCPVLNTFVIAVEVLGFMVIEIPTALRLAVFGSQREFENWLDRPIYRRR